MLQSKHPILAVPMNKVSDLNLALACHSAGVYPSLCLHMYYKQRSLWLTRFYEDLKTFQKATGSTELLISMTGRDFSNPAVLEILSEFDVLRIEIVEDFDDNLITTKNKLAGKDLLLASKEIGKSISFDSDIIIVKGKEAAGRISNDNETTREKFLYFKHRYPDKCIIPSGGIGSKNQIKEFLDLGAPIVGIGTVFAASVESPISIESKKKMAASSLVDLSRFKNSNQNALIFREIENDDANHSLSLKIGTLIPTNGHLFAGESIEYINGIRLVADIVEDLVE